MRSTDHHLHDLPQTGRTSPRIAIPEAAAALARALGTSTEAVVLACFGWLVRIATGQTTLQLHATVGSERIALPCAFDDNGPVEFLVADMRDEYRLARPRAGAVLLACDAGGFALSLQIVGVRDLVLQDHAGVLGSDAIARWAEVFAHLLALVSRERTTTLRDVAVVPHTQRAALIELGANRDDRVADDGATIDDLFKACVWLRPQRRAVVDETTALTYTELDRRADALARYLVAHGLEVGDRVAIEMPPSVHVAVAMLGVLRARGAYVPLDPNLPADRRRFVLADAGARFVIGVGPSSDRLDVTAITDVARQPLPRGTTRDAAYVIYTSGTTGQPKGVVVEQRSLVNYVRWMSARYGIDDRHVAALLTSFAFDLGYTTLWPTLLGGGELHFLPEAACRDVAALPAYVRAHAVSFLKVTPSLLGALVRSPAFDRAHCSSLRLVVCGGEPIRLDDVATVYARCPDALVVNHYGPTETTIGVMTQPLERTRLAELANRPVIGRPIGNTVAYVVSPSLALVPMGAPGELLVGGAGVARGYHARDELTREKFIDDPFAASGRVYRTGDLVRWTEHGTLEFLGRIDRQVKIRGYRVELPEIEQVMLRQLAIDEVVVIDRPPSGILCAYYVAARPLDAIHARTALAAVLPDYMVPAHYTQIAAVPRTANGKLDVARLPAPLAEAGTIAPVESPSSPTERILAELWSDVLGLPAAQIGVAQNFFELGGHSLHVIQLVAEIHDRFGATIAIPSVFADGTIRALARLVDEAAR